MVVFNLPTIINDKELIHNSMLHTIRLINPNIKKEQLLPFYNLHRNDIINYFVNKQKINSPQIVKTNLASEFHYFLKKELINNQKNLLIHKKIPILFSTLKNNNIKVGITSDYSVNIQDSIMNHSYFKDKVDDFMFDINIFSTNSTILKCNSNKINILLRRNEIIEYNRVIIVNNYLSQQYPKFNNITIMKDKKINMDNSNLTVSCIMDIEKHLY